jgi:hypothetical protein
MTLFLATFEALAALLVIGLLGFWIIRRRVVPGQALRFLSPLAIEIALPCLVFVKIIRGLGPSGHTQWWIWPLAFVGFMAWAGLLTTLCTLFVQRARRREFAFALLFQNITFLPLVILTQVRGADSSILADLFLFGLLFSPVFFNAYHLFFAGRRRALQWSKTAHPVVVASIVAVVLSLVWGQDVVPDFLMSSLELLGGMTVPLLMLILGGNLYVEIQKRGKLHVADATKFVVAKNIVFPLATLAVLVLFRAPQELALILFLQSAVPPIASIPIFVEREGGDAAAASQFIIASFTFSLVSIPALMEVFALYFPVF